MKPGKTKTAIILTAALLAATLLALTLNTNQQQTPWSREASRLEELAERLHGEPAKLLLEAAETLQHLKTTTTPQQAQKTTTTTTTRQLNKTCTWRLQAIAEAINKTINNLEEAIKDYEKLKTEAARAAEIASTLLDNLQQQAKTSGSIVGPLGVDYAEMLAKATEAIHTASKIQLEESQTILNYAQAILALSQAAYRLSQTCSS